MANQQLKTKKETMRKRKNETIAETDKENSQEETIWSCGICKEDASDDVVLCRGCDL